MMISLLCSLQSLILIIYLFHSNIFLINATSTFEEKHSHREELLHEILSNAAGVYKHDASKIHHEDALHQTVFLSILSFHETTVGHYRLYLRNFICYLNYYQIDVIFYILHNGHLQETYQHELDYLQNHFNVKIFTYPDELFWKILHEMKPNVTADASIIEEASSSSTAAASATTTAGGGGGLRKHRLFHSHHVGGKASDGHHSRKHHQEGINYETNHPSIYSYGAFTKLIPILEVLEMGFNVIYSDIDVAFIQDPIPYLISNPDVDVIAPIESSSCPHYPRIDQSSHHHSLDSIFNPHFGIFYWRHTDRAIRLLKNLLYELLQLNTLYEDIAIHNLKFHYILHSSFHQNAATAASSTASSTAAATTAATTASAPAVAATSSTESSAAAVSLNDDHDIPLIQLLPETIFQNGDAISRCPIAAATKDEWFLLFHSEGIMKKYIIDDHEQIRKFPVLLHFNTIEKKIHELQSHGLWLLPEVNYNVNHDEFNQSTCHNFNIIQTSFYNNDDHEYQLIHNNHNNEINNKMEIHFNNPNHENLEDFDDDNKVNNHHSLRGSLQRKNNIAIGSKGHNGTLVRTDGDAAIYVIDSELRKHLIPDVITFNTIFGIDAWNKIIKINKIEMKSIPNAIPLPTLDKKSPAEVRTVMQKIIKLLHWE